MTMTTCLDLDARPRHDDRLEAIQRLRYEVYCLEQKFRDAADCPDGRERDEYDPLSIHVYAIDGTGAVVGTVRVVRDSPLGLPAEGHGAVLSIPSRGGAPGTCGEISRLIVAKRYRRETIDHPLLLWGLFGRAYEESRRQGITYWVAAMEEMLWRLLRRFGFHFARIGAPVNYFGPVVPYGATLDALESGYQKIRDFQRRMASTRPELVEKFRSEERRVGKECRSRWSPYH